MKQNKRFTPGPWKRIHNNVWITLVDAERPLVVETEADALLIAAAPEMYDALERAVDRLGDSSDYYKDPHYIDDLKFMIATLKKARGEK